MGNLSVEIIRRKALMFNKKAANPKNKPDQILDAIGLKSGQTIADIGSGGGYFSFRFAEIVGDNGRVYAVDTNQAYLGLIKHNAEEWGLDNVKPVFASGDKLDMPESKLDIVFMRNVTHHIEDRKRYFRNFGKYMKSDGRFVVIEYNKGKPIGFRRLFGHYVPKGVIIEEMDEVGFDLENDFDFLPEQHFCIFSRAEVSRSA